MVRDAECPRDKTTFTRMGKPRYSEDTLTAAHKHTAFNEAELRRSEQCVCMFCGHVVKPTDLDRPDVGPDANEQYWPDGNWVADAEPGGRSATCPKCRIDALIGDASGYPVHDRTFQIDFGTRWWGDTPITRGEDLDSDEVVRVEVE